MKKDAPVQRRSWLQAALSGKSESAETIGAACAEDGSSLQPARTNRLEMVEAFAGARVEDGSREREAPATVSKVRQQGASSRRAVLVLPALLLLATLWGCDYAGMMYQEAIDTFKTKMVEMPQGTIPVTGGLEELKTADLDSLRNPLPSTPETVASGKLKYSYYCIQCHGPKTDGMGTVGQSFSPLPSDLRQVLVQDQSDGDLFYKIGMGYMRHPPLAATIAVDDRWAIITYIRSLASKPSS